MPDTWRIHVYDQQPEPHTYEVSGKVELGRQGDGVERIYSKRFVESKSIPLKDGRSVRKEAFWRIVIANRDEDSVSRDHAFLEPLTGGRARLENVSSKVTIRLEDGSELGPSASCEVALPTVLTLGRKVVRILEKSAEDRLYESLPEMPSTGSRPLSAPSFAALAVTRSEEELVEIEEIIGWLRDAMGILQSVAGSSDFFDKAARAVVDTVGLDTGHVVLLREGEWKVEAAWSAEGLTIDPDQRPSQQILAMVREQRKTNWTVPTVTQSGGDSLLGVSAVVAAPIMVRGEVIGAIYGDRRRYAAPGQPPRMTKMDAMLVEFLAASVAAGLARMEGERAAVAARVQFEQFFTPDLARQIESRPELLEGQDSEITLLFCDIRGFSRISERLGPAKTVRWVNDVMGRLSDCVLAHSGVLVDYIGDELMAMWAPQEQPDHAAMACRAAVDMLAALPEMNSRFLPEIGEHFDLGIGVNTGIARVGNTGSKHKFKYGPLGNTVNLASRVQGITKYLKVRLVATRATHDRLGGGFAARRLGRVRVVNIAEPVDMYELGVAGDPKWDALRLEYESALAEFERGGFRMATKILGGILTDHPDDGPSMVLLSRVVNGLVDPENFDPVFVAPGK